MITLTTDWGQKDWYCGKIKGLLYSSVKDVEVIDISHNVPKFDLNSAAFVVKNACLNFPENTIHIIDVNTYETQKKAFIAVKYNKQFYICTDNGLPSMVFENGEIEITDFTNVFADSNYYNFATQDIFVKVAALIAKDLSADNLGNRKEKLEVESSFPRAVIRKDSIICNVIYIDDYGNCYLNCDDVTFDKVLNERSFEIMLDLGCYIRDISHSYADKAIRGQILMTVSSSGFLELAIREDNLAKLMGLETGSQVVIKMQDKKDGSFFGM